METKDNREEYRKEVKKFENRKKPLLPSMYIQNREHLTLLVGGY